MRTLNKLECFESTGFIVESEQVALAMRKGLRIKEVPINVKYNIIFRSSGICIHTSGNNIRGIRINSIQCNEIL